MHADPEELLQDHAVETLHETVEVHIELVDGGRFRRTPARCR